MWPGNFGTKFCLSWFVSMEWEITVTSAVDQSWTIV